MADQLCKLKSTIEIFIYTTEHFMQLGFNLDVSYNNDVDADLFKTITEVILTFLQVDSHDNI